MIYFDRAPAPVVLILMLLLFYGFLLITVRFFVIGWSGWNMNKFNVLVRGGYFSCALISVSLTIGLIFNTS